MSEMTPQNGSIPASEGCTKSDTSIQLLRVGYRLLMQLLVFLQASHL